MTEEYKYLLCLANIDHIGPRTAKQLINTFGSAEAIFRAKKRDLLALEGFGSVRTEAILNFNNFSVAEAELQFVAQHGITILSINDEAYPTRLKDAVDAPLFLFYKGNANLNNTKILSVIGRRKSSEYGDRIVRDLMQGLANQDVLIISGLAYGIDTLAHKYALENGLATVGVLAHGLDRIYPPNNAQLAKAMQSNGGILSEFFSKTNPDKENFPIRNRIVAAMSDATVVVETDIEGGSMITVNLANGYNREVFAYPGDVYTQNSAGCNYLIKSLKASLVTNANDIIEFLDWETNKQPKARQQQLFIELEPNERMIYDYLKEKEQVDIDELMLQLPLTPSQIASGNLGLELKGLLKSLPGKAYRLI